MALAQIQRWEIGGVAMGPLVLAFATSSFPARFGWTATDVYEAALILASLVAAIRALWDSRKQPAPAETLQRASDIPTQAAPSPIPEAPTKRLEDPHV